MPVVTPLVAYVSLRQHPVPSWGNLESTLGLQVGRASPPSRHVPPCRLRSATWKPAPNSYVGPAFYLGTLNAGSSPKDTFLNLAVSEPPSSAVLYVPATCSFFKSLEANPWLSWQEHFPFLLSCSSSLPTKLFNNSESAWFIIFKKNVSKEKSKQDMESKDWTFSFKSTPSHSPLLPRTKHDQQFVWFHT